MFFEAVSEAAQLRNVCTYIVLPLAMLASSLPVYCYMVYILLWLSSIQ